MNDKRGLFTELLKAIVEDNNVLDNKKNIFRTKILLGAMFYTLANKEIIEPFDMLFDNCFAYLLDKEGYNYKQIKDFQNEYILSNIAFTAKYYHVPGPINIDKYVDFLYEKEPEFKNKEKIKEHINYLMKWVDRALESKEVKEILK